MTCKLYFIVSCMLVLCTCCHPEKKKDTQLPGIEIQTMERLDTLLASDPSKALSEMDSLLPLLKDSILYYRGIVFKSKAYMLTSCQQKADSMLKMAERFCASCNESEEELSLRASVFNMEGNQLARQTKFDSACVKFLQAYNLYTKIGEKIKRFNVMLNLADVYIREGYYDKGSLWYHHSLALADSLGLSGQQCFPAYYGLGQVYMELRDFAQCDTYFDRAGRYYDDMKPFEKNIYLNNRGNSYYFRQDYPTALKYFRRSMACASAHPEMEYERNLTMINLGEVFLLMNQTDSASYYLSRCYDFFKKVDNNSALYYIDTQLIELALKEGNLPLAQKRLKEAVKPAFVEPNMIHIRNRYLQHYFEQSKDFRQAYYYLRENSRIDDSIRSERIKMRAQEFALRYQRDSTLMAKEILIQQTENKVLILHQWLYIGGLTVLFLIIATGAWLLYRKKKHDMEELKMQAIITSLQLKNIRNRISPHFIFNILGREINSLKDQESNAYLHKLIKLIRRNLELAESTAVTLADELDFVKTYIAIEERVLQPDFEMYITIAPTLDIRQIKIPVTLLQIPVENAVKHALIGKEGRRLLWIEIKDCRQHIEIVIRNNGGGFRMMTNGEGTGTGLKILAQTIQLLNSYNPDPIVMTIDNVKIEDREEIGCEIKFTIPVNYSYLLRRIKDINLWRRFTERLLLMTKKAQ